MNILNRVILALAALACAGAAASEGIAFITNLKGDVFLGGVARPALLSEVARGQKITVGKESLAQVMYITSGKEYVLKGPADYIVGTTEVTGALGMPPITRNTDWRASGKVLVQVSQTSAASVRMRSAAPAKTPQLPSHFPAEGPIASLQPVFTWPAQDAKQPGEFVLLVAGQEKPVHRGKSVGGTYKLPAKLKPETEYAWTVTSGGHEAGGSFRTLPLEAVTRIEKRRPGERAEFSDRLLFTLLLQEMGARQEARESWARLAQERADLPELAGLAR
jgi:hypothetical protein